MSHREQFNKQGMQNPAAGPPKDEPERLLERYGHHMEEGNLCDDQKKEFLMALWQIMRAFAEVGFSIKSGDKLHVKSDAGFDDVLRYLIPEETAHETLAPKTNAQGEEQV